MSSLQHRSAKKGLQKYVISRPNPISVSRPNPISVILRIDLPLIKKTSASVFTGKLSLAVS